MAGAVSGSIYLSQVVLDDKGSFGGRLEWRGVKGSAALGASSETEALRFARAWDGGAALGASLGVGARSAGGGSKAKV